MLGAGRAVGGYKDFHGSGARGGFTAWWTNDFYGAISVSQDGLRGAAQEQALDGAVAARTEKDEIGLPVLCKFINDVTRTFDDYGGSGPPAGSL